MNYSSSMLIVSFLILLLLIPLLMLPSWSLYLIVYFIFAETSILVVVLVATLLFSLLLIIETLLIYLTVALLRFCRFRISWTKKKKHTIIWMPFIVLTVTFTIIALAFVGPDVGIHTIANNQWIPVYVPYITGTIGAIYLSIVLTDGNPKIK